VPITTGSSFSPSAFTKNAHISHCSLFSLQCTIFPWFLGFFRETTPKATLLIDVPNIAFHLVGISLARSFQLFVMSLLISPAGYGLEIPWKFCFSGYEFSVQWLKSKLEGGEFL